MAYEALDRFEKGGWDLYKKIEQDYVKTRVVTSEQVSAWYQDYEAWRSVTERQLNDVFVSPNEANEFRYSKGSFGVMVGENHQYSNVQNSLWSRIQKLIEYKKMIRDRFDVHFTAIIQNGDSNQASIRN